VRGEQVEDRLKLVDGAQVQLDQEAVLAGDPVALGHVRNVGGDPRDEAQSAAGRADPHDRADRVAEGARVDLGTIGQDAGVLESPQPVGDRWTGQPDPPAQLGDPEPRRGSQLLGDPAVDRVKR
jgi:hypothetical protein